MLIQEVRDARGKGVVAYTKFCLDREYHNTNLFCFYEGEDIKYYGQRIERYSGYTFDRIIFYNCGGKKQVLKAYELIRKETSYKYVKKAFFVDRDFDPINTTKATEIYQTPCYSIENFYTSVEAFKRLIYTEFGINTIESDFDLCVSDYKRSIAVFHDSTRLLNAWICYQREKEKEQSQKLVILSDYNISKLFCVLHIDHVEPIEEINIDVINREFPKSYAIEEDEFQKITSIFDRVNPQQCFRGKFELQFFRHIIEDLKRKNCDGGYLTIKRNCVRIDVNSNPLSALSLYADTPDDLVAFLTTYQVAS